MAFFVTLGFVRFVGKSASLQPPAYPGRSLRGYTVQRGIPAKNAGTFPYGDDVASSWLAKKEKTA